MDKVLQELVCKLEASDPVTSQIIERVCLDASTIHRCVSCGSYKSSAWVCDRKIKICWCANCVIERTFNNE